MTHTKEISDRELMTKGAEILFKELGYVDTIRFLTMPKDQREESVQRHRNWQNSLDQKKFLDEAFKS